MKIEVTQQDIDNGVPGDAESCPVALACQRTIPGCHDLTVGDDTIEFDIDGDAMAFDLPAEVATFVHRFDCKDAVAPFAFDLDVEP